MGWDTNQLDLMREYGVSRRALLGLSVVFKRAQMKFFLLGVLSGACCVMLGACLAWWFFNQSYTITG